MLKDINSSVCVSFVDASLVYRLAHISYGHVS